ncbi:hypothetical protein [Formosa sp. S-31]|uniref:hypothetical protein n=1 Tax=Formosa sp. S-31 TaxID=2790949 RepID=UPI003EBE525A
MKTNKNVLCLILLFTSLFSYAQGTAYDLKDIVDMRGSSSERVLEDRGYHLEKVDKSSAGIYQQWWNSRKDQCVTVRLEDGKVRSVVKAPDLDCGKGSSSSHSSSRYDDDLDLSDFRGMSEVRASTKLQDKGYRVKKQYGSSLISTYWYKERNDKCLLMLIKNDEVSSLTKVSSKLCDGDSNYISHSSGNRSHSNRGVTLYKKCDFLGDSKTLEVGRYNDNELGIGNDKLSSIEVPRGYKITLYKQANFEGTSRTYYEDERCLDKDEFNNNVSSVKVSRD